MAKHFVPDAMKNYLAASNVAVGFRFAGPESTDAETKVVASLHRGFIEQMKQSNVETPFLPQNAIAAVLNACLAIHKQQPVLLVGCFYRGYSVKLGQLAKWAKLDQRQVFSDLFLQLESPAQGLLDIGLVAKQHIETIESSGANDLSELLDAIHAKNTHIVG